MNAGQLKRNLGSIIAHGGDVRLFRQGGHILSGPALHLLSKVERILTHFGLGDPVASALLVVERKGARRSSAFVD